MGDDYTTRVPPLEWITLSSGKLGLTYLDELKQSQVAAKAASSVTPCFFSHVSLLYKST